MCNKCVDYTDNLRIFCTVRRQPEAMLLCLFQGDSDISACRGDSTMTTGGVRHFLVASDFDQTLSFNDSGAALSELIGASRSQDKVEGLARTNLVQQGGELAYLIRHDPEFRGVRREHLEETGRRVRLRSSIPALVEFLERGIEGCQFSFYVISAALR